MTDFATVHFPVGVAIGLAGAAPVGPINVLVIRRALGKSIGSALALGVAGAAGDSVFAVIAAFGLGAMRGWLEDHAGLLRIFGGLVMLVFAITLWRARPHIEAEVDAASTLRMVMVVICLTLTNPATILFFLGSFTALGITGTGHDTPEHLLNAALLVAGTFSGSLLWWVIISTAAHRLRDRVTDAGLVFINRGTAVLLVMFGLYAIYSGVLAR